MRMQGCWLLLLLTNNARQSVYAVLNGIKHNVSFRFLARLLNKKYKPIKNSKKMEKELINIYESFLNKRKLTEDEIKIAYGLYSDIFNHLILKEQPKIFDKIMDALVTVDYQDENWKREDTVRLIMQKLTGESPLEYVNS